MRIAWITLDALTPLNTAGRLGVYKRIEQLWDLNDIYLFYFYGNDYLKCQEDDLLCKCKEIHAYEKISSKLRLIMNYLSNPFTLSTRMVETFVEDIEKCIINNNIELINIDFPQMAWFLLVLKDKIDIPVVLNQHNIEWQRFFEISNSKSINWIKRIASRAEAIKLKQFEEKLYRCAPIYAMTFVADEDRDYFKKWIPEFKGELVTIQGGADIYDRKKVEHDGYNIVFVGVMSNELNPEGALWFISTVMPLIEAKIPNIRLYVVGKDPIRSLLEINKKNVCVTGSVASVDEYYDIADLVIIPIQHGGGVKLKLLEAISHKCPVVTTSQGARGTSFQNMKEIYIDDTAEGFAEKCIYALNNPKVCMSMVNNAMKRFENTYTWNVIGRKYNNFLLNVIEDFDRTKNNESLYK